MRAELCHHVREACVPVPDAIATYFGSDQPRITVEVETGEEYSELRGVMLKAECTIHRDLDTVAGVGEELLRLGPGLGEHLFLLVGQLAGGWG